MSSAPPPDETLLSLLADPEVRRDPHDAFSRLREASPLARATEDIWVVSSADLVAAVLQDPDSFSSDLRNATAVFPDSGGEEPDAIASYSRHMMIFTDPPDHTRLRGLVQQAFTPRRVRELQPVFERLAADLLDQAVERGSMEVIQDLALPLPVSVICELMGISAADRPRVHDWADVLSAQLDNLAVTDMEARAHADQVLEEYAEFLRHQFARRREDPGDDLISALVQAKDGEDKLSEDELIATCVLLLGAGHETTVGMIGNGTLAFLRNPDEYARLRADRSLLHTAVEECFRYDGPVRLTHRASRPGAELAGIEIPEGDLVMLLLAAANRDPSRFPDPDRFDVGRDGEHSFASGFGIHWCLGGVLSRAEVGAAFGALLDRFRRLEPALDLQTVEMRDAMMICRPSSLPVTVVAA
ncbi:MAG: cytochrome P450 [Actinomycetota bacterium]|nr:cytochrome P450 [Actinomycetota bacterium]